MHDSLILHNFIFFRTQNLLENNSNKLIYINTFWMRFKHIIYNLYYNIYTIYTIYDIYTIKNHCNNKQKYMLTKLVNK